MNQFWMIFNNPPKSMVTWVLNFIAASSLTLIHYDDTKWNLPIVIWSIISLFVVPFFWKLFYFIPLVGCVYFWVLLFRKKHSRNVLLVIFTVILWSLIVYQGYILFLRNSFQIVIDNRSAWYYIPATLFLVSSLGLLYKSWHYSDQT